jgi:VanZ family protein
LKLSAPEKLILDLLGRHVTLRLLRIGFVFAVIGTFALAVAPESQLHGLDFIPWDKAEHFIAFFSLTVLAATAFPATPLLLIGVLLSAFGALIEVVQGLDFVGRDEDFWDWVADTIAIGAAVLPMLVARWRLVSEG